MRDKDFLADAQRARLDVVASTGERVQQLIEHLYAAPKATVERAKDLLREGRLSLAQVAAAVGFADQSHLTRHFKRLVGVTPRQFLGAGG